MSEIPRKLKEVWTLKPEKKVAKSDAEAINSILKLNYFYQTDLLPQPWWGNIVNPDVIFLALNPSYDPVIDDEDEPHIASSLAENLKSKTMNWLRHKEITNKNGQKRETSGFKWWKHTLEGLYNSGIPNDEEKIYVKVGFFQLCGYHSKNYNELKKICLKENYSMLPTQEAIVEHVNDLIKEHDPYVVIVWGKEKWVKAGLKFNSDKLVVLNALIYNNHHYSKAPEKYKFIKEEIYNKIKE